MLQPITKENFGELLSQFTTPELENLVAKFPYTREAHVLLAKKYQLENNPAFDMQLQLAALYTQDRELLFNLFADKAIVQTTTAPLIKIEEPKVEPIAETPVEEIVSALPVQEEIIAPIVEEPIGQLPVIEEKEPKPMVEVEDKDEEIKPPLSVEEQEAPQKIEEPVEIVPATVEKKETPEIQAFSADELHTFDEWMANFAGLPTLRRQPIAAIEQKPEQIEAEQEELDKTIMENVSSDYLHNMVDEETRYAKGLDKFIEEQVMKRRKGEYKKPVTQQDDISEEMITETMAGIYEKQKKYAKAIKAYEVLSLKFPEKNDLFAARINYLKTII